MSNSNLSTYSFQDLDRGKYEKILARRPVGFYEISFAAERLIAVDNIACQISGLVERSFYFPVNPF
jgi:hypothetical protein